MTKFGKSVKQYDIEKKVLRKPVNQRMTYYINIKKKETIAQSNNNNIESNNTNSDKSSVYSYGSESSSSSLSDSENESDSNIDQDVDNVDYSECETIENVIDTITNTKETVKTKTKKMCIHPECYKYAIYNYKNQPAIYCETHKLDKMVRYYTPNSYCKYEDCLIQSNWNFEGLKHGDFCSVHKADGMVDVKIKHCVYKDCKGAARYNYEGYPARYCKDHKFENMVCSRINLTNKCKHPDCTIDASFNYPGEKVKFCAGHKLDGMVNVKNYPICKTPLCGVVLKNKSIEYCKRCSKYMIPNTIPDSNPDKGKEPASSSTINTSSVTTKKERNYKNKEKTVSEFIDSSVKIPEGTSWVTDKKIDGGCSRRRPDKFLDLGNKVIIVEVDENQHINYDCSCENKRLMEISQDFAHRPIIFIRFNPDDYKKGDAIVKSCWTKTKTGLVNVPKNQEIEWLRRLNSLKEQIEYWIENDTDKTVEVIQLYYDC